MDNKIKKLHDKLVHANVAYRSGLPFITDAEFDALEEELRIIDPSNEWFKRGVNDSTPKKKKVKLPYPMMSLNKFKTIETLKEWMKSFPESTFIITPKFDGLSVGLEGNISWTRGDGTIGQDCTKHLMHTIKPDIIDKNNVIRGEIIINNSNWKRFKEINPEAVSSRNSATGLINGDFDANRIKEYNLLSIMPYEIVNSGLSKECQMIQLNGLYRKVWGINDVNDDYLLNLFLEWKSKYPIDGLVIDVNEAQYRVGTEANGNPSYSVAYKSPKFSETGTAIIKDVELNVNRYGVITPVAILEEPIFLSGASINRVSAINMNYVSLWGIIPGEKVTIVRSGEVIPKIIAVNDIFIPFRETYNKVGDYLIDYNNNATNRHFQMEKGSIKIPERLTVCPKCGTKLKELVNESGDWCEMYCPNNNCYGRKIETAIKFFSICKIDGFGDKKITQIANGFIETDKPIFFEVLNVDENYLLGFEGWADTSAKAFINECNKIKNNLPFARFLHATGWFGELGEKTLQKIIDSDGWDMPIEQLITIEGIQNKTAITFLAGKQMYYAYESYIKENFKFDYVKTFDNKKDGKLNDLVICMTGFRDKILSAQITELGGTVLDSVTKNVNCVVTKDKNSSSSKITKAKKLGIEVLEINEFKEKYL